MPLKCDKCGIETKVDAAFYTVPHWNTGAPRRFCPPCWLKVQTARHKQSLFSYLVVVFVAVGLIVFNPENSFAWSVLNLILFYVLTIVAALPHELGHALTAIAVGFRSFQVRIGFGKTIFERRFWGTEFQLNAIPLGGFAFAAPKTAAWYRTKLFLIVLAGPLANLLLAALSFLAIPLNFDFTGGLRPGITFLAANLVCFAYSTWPHMINTSLGRMPNDGLILWRTFSKHSEQVLVAMTYYFLCEGALSFKDRKLHEARKWFEKGLEKFPGDLNLLNALGSTHISLCNYEQARAIFLDLLSRPKLSEHHQALFSNNLAYVNTLIGGDELIKEADEYSRQALESMPFVSYFKGTRGYVFVELGRFEEGLALLKEAMEQAPDHRSKALNACHIAIAEKRRGNLEKSEEYAKIARSFDKDCLLLERLK
jgi:Tfp pilus assembly protein PilF